MALAICLVLAICGFILGANLVEANRYLFGIPAIVFGLVCIGIITSTISDADSQKRFNQVNIYLKSTWDGEYTIDTTWKGNSSVRFYSHKKQYYAIRDSHGKITVSDQPK